MRRLLLATVLFTITTFTQAMNMQEMQKLVEDQIHLEKRLAFLQGMLVTMPELPLYSLAGGKNISCSPAQHQQMNILLQSGSFKGGEGRHTACEFNTRVITMDWLQTSLANLKRHEFFFVGDKDKFNDLSTLLEQAAHLALGTYTNQDIFASQNKKCSEIMRQFFEAVETCQIKYTSELQLISRQINTSLKILTSKPEDLRQELKDLHEKLASIALKTKDLEEKRDQLADMDMQYLTRAEKLDTQFERFRKNIGANGAILAVGPQVLINTLGISHLDIQRPALIAMRHYLEEQLAAFQKTVLDSQGALKLVGSIRTLEAPTRFYDAKASFLFAFTLEVAEKTVAGFHGYVVPTMPLVDKIGDTQKKALKDLLDAIAFTLTKGKQATEKLEENLAKARARAVEAVQEEEKARKEQEEEPLIAFDDEEEGGLLQ